jgi:hypothetical protein
MNAQQIPVGLCQCGCGQATRIAKRTYSCYRIFKGQPLRYIAGHERAHARQASRALVVDGVECRTIPLTQGCEAIVDAGDYPYLAQFHWYVDKSSGTTSYAKRKLTVDGRNVSRFIHQEVCQVADGQEPDHINGNGLDNRRCNLRPAPHRSNIHNRKRQSNNTSGFIGVCWHKQREKWAAALKAPDGKKKSLGLYVDILDAAKAYDAGARRYFGNFARLNFPENPQI